ncbi:peptidase M23B [Rhizorhabdus wittichii RW1]|uniref:Peptidase M23B n=1 Tax=Rhizorhabdus wittichii (strain DSM 6014 / CCUG 31198 / JCM 15750 / NBRC 105917 / EY 4224 / RW1) TaxID=392499 RepID=A0A9J9LDN2_RHIWR|nr:peptidase M23B [Rhizorhabdus wittichii RW1]
MFRSDGQDLSAQGYAGGASRGALVVARTNRFPAIGRLIDSPIGDAVDRLAGADLVVDLGARIGSREWFRGLLTCLGLCTAAGMMAPDFKPIGFVAEPPMSAAHQQQVRTLGIAPLGLGGDTGQRIAATSAVEPLTDTPERPRVELAATIGQGDGFARVLERAGVSRDEAGKVASMVSDAVPLDDLRAGTRMDLVLGRREVKSDPRPLETLDFRARFDLKLAVERVDGALRLKRIPIAVDHTPLRIQGRVGSSLYRSARAAGVPADAIEAFIKAISQKLSMRSIGSDARFDAIIEHARAETGEVKVGDLLFAGVTEGGKKVQMVKWTTGNRAQWYEASGVGETKGVMRKPVLGHLTSSFGMRFHPILGFSRMHQGVDFGAPMGSPIVAASDGVVTFAGRHGGHGNYVRLNHAGGIATGYAHMSRIIAKAGQHVRQGELIGYVGSTGLSTGPHLHYEMYRNGKAINPTSMKFTTVQQLAGRDLANFKAKLNGLLSVRVAHGAGAEPKAEKSAETDGKDDGKGRGKAKKG